MLKVGLAVVALQLTHNVVAMQQVGSLPVDICRFVSDFVPASFCQYAL